MSTYENHDARQYGDTTECHKCGKQWDTNDPHPPKCITETETERKQQIAQRNISKLKRLFK